MELVAERQRLADALPCRAKGLVGVADRFSGGSSVVLVFDHHEAIRLHRRISALYVGICKERMAMAEAGGTMSVLAAQRWQSNAYLIADVAKLGYLDGSVLDVTYGLGVFWQQWRPESLTACDLDVDKSPMGVSVDFTDLPFDDRSFNAVVFDPPYKLNGTPTESVDSRYGVHQRSTWQDRHTLICNGIDECARVSKRIVLLKCMDQVVSGHKRWQTIEFTNHAATKGLDLIDRFDLLVNPRPQPSNRRQLHAQGNYSTLLVFEQSRNSKSTA